VHHTSDPYLIRPGRPADIDRCAALNDTLHPYDGIGAWTRDLFDRHPSVSPGDFLVAEPAGGDGIAAALVGIRQEWAFAGIRLPVVQVELVGTDPRHRGRGLSGRLLHALHTRCAADGTALQVIEGIPYFYRRYGYEYALNIGGAPDIPAERLRDLPLPPRRSRPGLGPGLRLGPVIRPATPSDAPALARLDRTVAGRDVLTCVRDEHGWIHEISGHRDDSLARRAVLAVPDASGDVTGYLVHGRRLGTDGSLPVFAAVCGEHGAWPRVVPIMLRHLAEAGAAAAGPQRPFTSLRLRLPDSHPLARFAHAGTPQRPRAWYARTGGDPAALLDRWLPVLARRWREQGLRWPGDTMVIDTYHQWIRLHFAKGTPVTARAEPRGSERVDETAVHAAVPPGALLQMLLGHRSPKELQDIWPDMIMHDAATAEFLEAGFPAVPPEIWAVA
jgi:ribosomal protein S18 acetylase RimI-like enzyme